VLRSCWNYHEQPDAFRRWLDRAAAATTIVNPPALVRWNLHKGYLRDLAVRGVAIVPTEFVPAGASLRLADLLRARGWDDIVLKPAISAASANTRRFRGEALGAAQAFLDGHRGRDMMVQPYQRSTESLGEHSLVWIDGEVTHGVRKAARLAGSHESVSAATVPSTAERAFAAHALAQSPPGARYARIDLMVGDGGRLLLSELELIEPSLYLLQSPPALARFVRTLLA